MTNDSKITFQADGSPYSTLFDDIYFDTENGFNQSEAVFIDGNNLKQRFLTHQGEFVIAETGFGTGLNFLLVLDALIKANKQRKEPLQLRFISVEKYPLSKQQLTQSLTALTQLQALAEQLISQYPEQPREKAQLSFLNNTVTLELIFADATEGFSQLLSSQRHKKPQLVDAWFLDGFSPSKNPEMWKNELFEQITRLSKEQASLATFTVSGQVKRQLISAGFRIQKRRFSGKKSEILTAVFQHNPLSGKGYQQRPLKQKPMHVSIIGGGVASACAAYALTKAGVKVTVYCQDEDIAQGASSNNIGALYPLFHQQADDISLFYQKAFNYALACYQDIHQQGFSYDHDWCGLLEISYKPALELRQQHIAQSSVWPNSLIHSVDAEQASQLANIALPHGGLFIPNAGWVAPAQLVQQVFNAAKATNRLRIKTNKHIEQIQQLPDGKWQLITKDEQFTASVLIYCGGAQGIKLSQVDQLPLSPVRGQVTSMATNSTIAPLSTVVCHKGYLTPKNKGIHCIGATFDKTSTETIATAEDDDYNLATLERCLPGLVNWHKQDIVSAKARLRCMTPDHMPVVGPLPDIEAHKANYAHLSKDKNWRYHQIAPVVDNFYLLTGLGARGLCTAPLLADILSADICGTPYPVDNNELFNLAPNRFVIRDIIRRKFSE